MTLLPRMLALAASAVLACAAQAQPAQVAAQKVALTSLVGDTMSITHRRDTTGTNVQSNPVDTVKVPTPMFDHAVLKAAHDALGRAAPAASVAMLRVPAAGSGGDPTQLVVDGKVVPAHPLVEALRQQGFTHLLAATRHRAPNVVRLRDDVKIGTGQLEGLGFYIDRNIAVQRVGTAGVVQGIIAPHVYIRLTLVDLATLEVSGVQTITANAMASSASNPAGTDAWGAMTAEEKVSSLQRLIQTSVGQAAPLLFQPK